MDITDVIVLASGGLDSSACLHFYQSAGFHVKALFVDYGQQAAAEESHAIQAITSHLKVPLVTIICSGLEPSHVGAIPGRNAFLLTCGLVHIGDASGIIALGIHAGTHYADCAPEFVQQMQTVFDTYTGGRCLIGAPFLDWHKQMIWDYSRTNGLPVEQTYSCELGLLQPCGLCLSCKDIEVLYACETI